MEKPKLTLYERNGCHLCEEMVAGLEGWQSRLGFELCRVDVDQDPVLQKRYGARVPVLAFAGRELCHYFLDEGVLLEALQAGGPSA